VPKRIPAFLCALCIIAVLPAAACAQTSRKSSSRAANVKTGTLVSQDTAAATLTLKPRTGADITYRLTEKTRILREKRPADASVFKPGDAIVVRFRKSSVGPATLYDLCDKPSWEWLDRLRHKTTLVTIKEINDDTLSATEGADAAEVEYRHTDKTQWGKAGKPASDADFKPGDKVYVSPRLLPGGGIMAVAVSDAPEFTARLHERTRPTVTGAVRACDLRKMTLSLHSAAGDDRDFTLAPDCVVRMASKDVPLTSIRAGQTVTVHLKRDEEGEQVVTRITIRAAVKKKTKVGIRERDGAAGAA
jgi:hypothetical protein